MPLDDGTRNQKGKANTNGRAQEHVGDVLLDLHLLRELGVREKEPVDDQLEDQQADDALGSRDAEAQEICAPADVVAGDARVQDDAKAQHQARKHDRRCHVALADLLHHLVRREELVEERDQQQDSLTENEEDERADDATSLTRERAPGDETSGHIPRELDQAHGDVAILDGLAVVDAMDHHRIVDLLGGEEEEGHESAVDQHRLGVDQQSPGRRATKGTDHAERDGDVEPGAPQGDGQIPIVLDVGVGGQASIRDALGQVGVGDRDAEEEQPLEAVDESEVHVIYLL